MNAYDIAHGFAEERDWTDNTLLSLVLTYIDNQGSNDAFEDFLQQIADAEEEECSDDDDADEESDDVD